MATAKPSLKVRISYYTNSPHQVLSPLTFKDSHSGVAYFQVLHQLLQGTLAMSIKEMATKSASCPASKANNRRRKLPRSFVTRSVDFRTTPLCRIRKALICGINVLNSNIRFCIGQERIMANASSDAEDRKLWPLPIEKHFIDVLVEEQLKGNMQPGSEEVWTNAIAPNPKCKEFRKKGLDHRDLLGQLFNKSTANGFLQISLAQSAPNSDEEQELDEGFLSAGVRVYLEADSGDDIEELITPIEEQSRCTEKHVAQPEHSKGKKKKGEILSEMNEAIKRFMEVSKVRLIANESRKQTEKDTGIVSVEEAVGMLLYIVGHNKNTRLATNRFQHSLETIQQRFYHALRAIHSLRSMIIRLDNYANEHPGHFRESGKYYPWFKYHMLYYYSRTTTE
ncbi:hypothetical protein CFP56_042464, partial [Quercus suber]